MQAEKRTVQVVRHEWTLLSPAHYTEVQKAISAAEQDRAASKARGEHPGDIHVRSADELVIIGFEATRPKNVLRQALDAQAAEAM